MAITEAQQRLYGSAPDYSVYKQTLRLTHSAFSQAWNLTNYPEAFSGYDTAGGTLLDFIYVPFGVREPAVDGLGHQDLPVTISNVDPRLMAELEATAAASPEPIVVEYRVYIDSDQNPSPDPALVLQATEIEASITAVSFMASRADVINARFPYIVYTTRRFPGLER